MQPPWRGKPDRDWLINYSFHKDGNRIEILPNFPYLDFQKAGKPAPGLISAGRNGTFTWKFPILAVKVANNTRNDLVLSKAHFVISSLKRDLKSYSCRRWRQLGRHAPHR